MERSFASSHEEVHKSQARKQRQAEPKATHQDVDDDEDCQERQEHVSSHDHENAQQAARQDQRLRDNAVEPPPCCRSRRPRGASKSTSARRTSMACLPRPAAATRPLAPPASARRAPAAPPQHHRPAAERYTEGRPRELNSRFS